jgi:alkylhydroperoxidase family enzyme
MDIRHAVGVKVGIPGATLAELDDYRVSEQFTERERAALAFCEQMTRDDREVSDQCFARLREFFSEAEVVEIVFVVGYQIFASKFAKAFRLGPQGFSA